MPRKLTESAKKRREEKKQRIIEKPAEVPDHLKQSTVEFLYRTGKDAKEIIGFTGISKSTVYDQINRIKETGVAASKPRSGRSLTATSKREFHKSTQNHFQKPRDFENRTCKKTEDLHGNFWLKNPKNFETLSEVSYNNCPQEIEKPFLSNGSWTTFD
jgi:transposase